MVSPQCARRVRKDLAAYRLSPPECAPEVCLRDSKLDKVLFLIRGPADTPYEGGEYVLELTLPAEYPLAPPSLRMLTPSGRFAVSAKLCTSFSAFHPESWSPTYTFSTLVTSLVSFMTEDAPGLGSITATAAERRRLAAASAAYNEAKGLSRIFRDFRDESEPAPL